MLPQCILNSSSKQLPPNTTLFTRGNSFLYIPLIAYSRSQMSQLHVMYCGAGTASAEALHQPLHQPPTPRQRPGPPPRPLAERTPTRVAQAKKQRYHSYRREQKLQVVQWVEARRSAAAEARRKWDEKFSFDPPPQCNLFQEAQEYFNIPKSTILGWSKSVDRILQSKKGARRSVKGVTKLVLESTTTPTSAQPPPKRAITIASKTTPR